MPPPQGLKLRAGQAERASQDDPIVRESRAVIPRCPVFCFNHARQCAQQGFRIIEFLRHGLALRSCAHSDQQFHMNIRLTNEIAGANLHTFLKVFIVAVARDDDNREHVQSELATDAPVHFVTIHSWHPLVQHYRTKFLRCNPLQGVDAAIGFRHDEFTGVQGTRAIARWCGLSSTIST